MFASNNSTVVKHLPSRHMVKGFSLAAAATGTHNGKKVFYIFLMTFVIADERRFIELSPKIYEKSQKFTI
jgi:hypothetical protein